ncbi:ABC transporter ATP-binding protein [Campylobacter sp. MIT 97-5078]|uniref:ABC transporter ATP-binding protein n=2 Tax=Campylobacter sp. MIT 97-5078 TaxID=1548153 RepID=UPI000514236D|nr:ABC transporter ATP-binding protein [Campylobacter sp. MIT 97-5078]KGI57273.1 ABC transporter permease [Campylobacter sp. MIT 97-5078]TQR23583.1 ABC transporter ATP-binding protein [Campylobacter sp. MIT 97-5078]
MHKDMNLKEILIRFKPYYIEHKFYFLLVGLGIILSAIGTSLSAWIMEPVINGIFINKGKEMLYYLPLGIIGVYLLKDIGMYIQSYYTAFIGTRILQKLRDHMLKNIFSLDMSFFHKYRSGELMSRCTGDIGALQSIVSNIIPEFIRDLIMVVGLLAVVIYQSPTLAFFALVVIPLALYPLALFARKLRKIGHASQEKNADMLSRLSEIFSNIELIKANNANTKEQLKFGKENQELTRLSLKSARVDAAISPIMEIFGSIGVAVVIFIGGKEVVDGSLDVGKFSSFITALFMAYTPLKKLSSMYGRIQGAMAASERVFYLLDLRAEIQDGKDELKHIQRIEFKNVHLHYEEDKHALNGTSFAFEKGQICALVGPSGGGKSSIINLLLRFYDKQKGEILLNEKDITNYTLKSLRLRIALVTQNIYLFNDTIAENVAYSEEFDEARVLQTLKEASAYDFVQDLGGINTVLQEHGKNLSGGQKQRIAIARALYKNPDLLIFDEATSALDNESEKAIVASIEKLKNDHAILIIAHRLSTIENADIIAVIEKGKVIATGNNAYLLEHCSLYKKFKEKSIQGEEI